MFTGLVERVGTIEKIEEQGAARRFCIRLGDEEYLRDVQIGESIAVSGVCLTVTEYSSNSFSMQAVEETLRRTTLGNLSEGSKANIERAMRLDTRLGGHIVQGHVDGVGSITALRDEGQGWWVTFEPPFELMRHIVEKGSICIDGISLTVANVAYNKFSVAIIPHTREVTTAVSWEVGTSVNLETDVLAKHVERLLQWQRSTSEGGIPVVNIA
jgi:riboflavin synthase